MKKILLEYTTRGKRNFIEFFISIVDSNNSVLGDKGSKKTPNKKLLYNLSLKDMDTFLDALIIRFLDKGFEFCKNNTFVPNFQNP